MNIFYINVIEQNSGWGAECFVNRGFIHHGHNTYLLDYRQNRFKLSGRFLELNNDFDVLFMQRGDGFPLSLLSAVNRPRFFWASELVERCSDQDRLLSSKLFNHIFVRTEACKRIIVDKAWASEDQVSVLLSGFDDQVQFVMPNTTKDIDVLFVGKILPRRRTWLDQLGKSFRIREAIAFGPEMTALFNRAKIVLNIHAEDYLDTETRVFEVLGCGAFLLTERLSDENPFVSGAHLVEVNTCEEMKQKIAFYLENPTERETIARCGYDEAMLNHSYLKRAEYIASVFERYRRAAFNPAIDMKIVKAYSGKEFIMRQLERARVVKRYLKAMVHS